MARGLEGSREGWGHAVTARRKGEVLPSRGPAPRGLRPFSWNISFALILSPRVLERRHCSSLPWRRAQGPPPPNRQPLSAGNSCCPFPTPTSILLLQEEKKSLLNKSHSSPYALSLLMGFTCLQEHPPVVPPNCSPKVTREILLGTQGQTQGKSFRRPGSASRSVL